MSASLPYDADYDVEVDDVQSLALSGFPKMPVASYLPLAFEKAARLDTWLADLQVHTGQSDGAREAVINLAFSHRGLRAFGVEARTLDAFGPAFREGMAGSAHRSWDTGDLGPSAPSEWDWGSPVKPVDAVLLLFASSGAALDEAERKALAGVEKAKIGLVTDRPLRAGWPTAPGVQGLREHFGFVDGLSQPEFRLRHDDDNEAHLAPGELLLGYPNAAGTVTPTPTVPATLLARRVGLRVTPDGERCDFGRGGSYLVFRQLEQDVVAFWEFIEGAAKSLGSLERAAAKIIGRWRNGEPLTVTRDQPPELNAVGPKCNLDFRYVRDGDSDGRGCPIGAHIRRSNPRDALPDLRERHSLAKVERHRILRRGRPYGDPVSGWPDPVAMLQGRSSGRDGQRGLHFLCLNADIEQQFEFVQRRWLNDPTFVNGFVDEVDPVIGRPRAGARFVVPQEPSPCLVALPTSIGHFVTVRGGEYFFLPSAKALRYLAETGR